MQTPKQIANLLDEELRPGELGIFNEELDTTLDEYELDIPDGYLETKDGNFINVDHVVVYLEAEEQYATHDPNETPRYVPNIYHVIAYDENQDNVRITDKDGNTVGSVSDGEDIKELLSDKELANIEGLLRRA